MNDNTVLIYVTKQERAKRPRREAANKLYR